jgi:hypothetical protein
MNRQDVGYKALCRRASLKRDLAKINGLGVTESGHHCALILANITPLITTFSLLQTLTHPISVLFHEVTIYNISLKFTSYTQSFVNNNIYMHILKSLS